MAKQVPQQSDIDKQVEINKQTEKDRATAIKEQQSSQSESPAKAKVSSKSHSATKHSAEKVVSSQLVVKKDVVLLPKAEPIPSKRRRREPSQELSQSERLQANQSKAAVNTEKLPEPQPEAVKDFAEDKAKAPKSKSKAKQAVAAVTDKVIPKSDRVPATRRRREPSSTLSVSERATSETSQS